MVPIWSHKLTLAVLVALAMIIAGCDADSGGTADPTTDAVATQDTPPADDTPAADDESPAVTEDDGGPITVGISLPLTGDFADPGAGIERGYELWAEVVNDSGGLLGRQVELSILDDASDPDKAVADYEKLITQDQVDIVFGPFSSLLVIPTSAVAEREKMLFVEPAGASPSVFDRGLEYLFYAAPAVANRHGELVAEFILDLPDDQRPATAAYVALDDPFAQPIADGVKEILVAGGVETVFDQVYPPEQQDFQGLAAQIADSGADILIGGTQDVDAVGLVRALVEIGYQPDLVMMSTGPTQLDFDDEVGGAAEGILAPVGWSLEADYPSNVEFVEAYRAKFGEDPNEDPANGYTVGQVVAAAIEAVGCADPSDECQTALRDYVRETTFDTVVGPLGFEETGAPTGNHMILQWQSGAIEIALAPDESAVTSEIIYPKPEW
ncbi:MAG TPA: amino acid ABC transporter substrate-binding protein [Egibacteraceae bacterium]|nr:amino acid ABC transporter substrate-binding protein [Egibacteraceae bacterium]